MRKSDRNGSSGHLMMSDASVVISMENWKFVVDAKKLHIAPNNANKKIEDIISTDVHTLRKNNSIRKYRWQWPKLLREA